MIFRHAAWACLLVLILIALLPAGTILAHPTTFDDRAFRYAVLAFFLVLAYPHALMAALGLVSLVALSIETVQIFLPFKSASLMDLLPKAAGTSIGISAAICVLLLGEFVFRRS